MPAHPPSQATTTPAVDPSVGSKSRSTLAHLGMGKRRALQPQDSSLEAEVEDYLAAPASLDVCNDLIEYWQVCSSILNSERHLQQLYLRSISISGQLYSSWP